MGLGPLVGSVLGFAMTIPVAGKESRPRNPIVLVQQVFGG